MKALQGRPAGLSVSVQLQEGLLGDQRAESRDHPRDLAVKEMQAEPLVPLQRK